MFWGKKDRPQSLDKQVTRTLSDTAVRQHVCFSGEVQGVGFRFQCQMLAEEIGLTGWCRNMYDGRVEAEFQGERQDINKLIAQIRNRRYIRVSHVEITTIPVKQDETAFRIVYRVQ